MDPVSIAAIGWGISTAGWLVSPIISKLLNKSLSCLGSRSSDRLKKLDSKLLRLKHMAEKVEASSSSPQFAKLDNWTKKLKSAFYDVEDIIDAIDYHHLKTRAVHRSPKPTKQAFNVEPSSRQELSSAIKKLDDLITEGLELLSWEKSPANSFEMTNRPTIYKTAPTPPPAVFGRENDVQTIREMLRDIPAAGEPGPSTTKCYSVVAIHGLPGSGILLHQVRLTVCL